MANGSLCLLSAGSTVVRAIDLSMRSDRVVEIVGLFDGGLSDIDVGADPEVRAGL